MIEMTEREDVTPVCPHCERDLTHLHFQQLRGTFGRRYLYFCSHCRKALGVSHRKGFWMG